MKKEDDGREFVTCRLVARDSKTRRAGPRDGLLHAMATPGRKRCLRTWQECQKGDEKRVKTK